MTQEERWLKRYEEVVEFIEANHQNPSKHRIEEHDYLNWLKANRKCLNAGSLKAERAEMFKALMELGEEDHEMKMPVPGLKEYAEVIPTGCERYRYVFGG